MSFRIAAVGSLGSREKALADNMAETIKRITKTLATVSENAIFLSYGNKLPETWETIIEQQHLVTFNLSEPEELNSTGANIGSDPHVETIIKTDMADLMLAFWDENPDGDENAIWAAIHRSMEKGVPCLWLSKKSGKKYWAEDMVFEPYNDTLLADYINGFGSDDTFDAAPKVNGIVQNILLWFNGRYAKLLKKYLPGASAESTSDTMLGNDFKMPDPLAEAFRKKIVDAYTLYDERAMNFSRFYRGMAYMRAFLPLFATVALAFGFYGDLFVKFIHFLSTGELSKLEGGYQFASVFIVCLFFLIHAAMLSFSYYLANNTVIKKWHASFLKNRIISEELRFFAHIIPFGITLPVKSILQRSGFSVKRDSAEGAEVRRLLSESEKSYPAFKEAELPLYIKCISDYLESQLDYHRTSAERYRILSVRFEKAGNILSKLGIGFVLLRGIIPLLLYMILKLNPEIIDILKPTSNMLAMIIPAAAAYYAGKNTLLGLNDSFIKDQMMAERLEKALKMVNALKGHNVNYSTVRNLSEKIGILLLGNVSAWEEEMSKKQIKPL